MVRAFTCPSSFYISTHLLRVVPREKDPDFSRLNICKISEIKILVLKNDGALDPVWIFAFERNVLV